MGWVLVDDWRIGAGLRREWKKAGEWGLQAGTDYLCRTSQEAQLLVRDALGGIPLDGTMSHVPELAKGVARQLTTPIA
jgi:hypothetical protein